MAEMTRPKWLVYGGLLLAVAGLSAGAYFAARWAAGPPAEDPAEDGDEPEDAEEEELPGLPRGERFVKVGTHAREVFETFPGRAAAEGGRQVRALPGQRMMILKIHKWDGDSVKEGEVLLELNDEEYRRALEKAKAADDEELAKELQAMIDAAKVRSPIDGYVLEVHHDIGETPVDVGMPLVTLADPNSYSFRVVVPQQVVGTSAHLGARLAVDLESGAKAMGTVTSYEEAPEGSAKVVLGLDATAGLERDLAGTVRVPTSKQEVALVPKKAVTWRNGVGVVRVFETDTRTVEERTIATDGEIGDDWIVVAGVFAGEAVVVPDR